MTEARKIMTGFLQAAPRGLPPGVLLDALMASNVSQAESAAVICAALEAGQVHLNDQMHIAVGPLHPVRTAGILA